VLLEQFVLEDRGVRSAYRPGPGSHHGRLDLGHRRDGRGRRPGAFSGLPWGGTVLLAVVLHVLVRFDRS